MKKFILLIPFMFLLESCGSSLDDKINVLLENEIKKELDYPDTYEAVETLIDSAFTPFDEPEFYNKTVQLYELGKLVCEYDENITFAKEDMLYYDSERSYYSERSYSKSFYNTIVDRKYQEAKDEYDLNSENKVIVENEIKKLITELKSMMNEPPRFIGYKVIHSYRAVHSLNWGVGIVKLEYLIDSDITKVIMEYEYKYVVILYKLMLGENPILEINDLWSEDSRQIIRTLQYYKIIL